MKKEMRCRRVVVGRLVAVVLLVSMAMAGRGQVLRTAYFMEGSQYRMQLNPALAPDRGFVNLPVVGMTGAWVKSNALSVNDVSDLMKHGDNEDYYMADDFYGKLKDSNKADATVGTELISVGWWQGKGFWSIDVGVRAEGSIRVPRELVSFMRDMKGMNTNDYTDFYRDLSNEELNINAYTEIGVGYARRINDRLSIGGRLKGLLGQGNLRLKIHEAAVRTHLTGVDPGLDWTSAGLADLIRARGTASIEATAELESSFEGLDLITNDRGYIDQVKFDMKNTGVAGFGAAVDFGVAFKVSQAVTLSAAINDLGFISWSRGCTQVARAVTDDLSFDSSDPGDVTRFAGIIGSGEAINLHLLRLTPDSGKAASRQTWLTSTLALGGEYEILPDKLRVGALYTSRFSRPDLQNELTFSLNYHPRSLLDFAVSYSPLMCGGSSMGVAMKLGPLFLGTDYLCLSSKAKCCNALIGLSIPLGRRPAE